MKAHELARLLLEGPDVEVMTEGCDCYGDAADVMLLQGAVLIRRPRDEITQVVDTERL